MNFEHLSNPEQWQEWLTTMLAWVNTHLLVVGNLAQLLVILAVFLTGRILASKLEALLEATPNAGWYRRYGMPVGNAFKPIARPVVWLGMLWFAVFAAEGAGWPQHLMEGAVSLLTAWVVIRLASRLIRDAFWARTVATMAWSVAALNLLGLLDPVMSTLGNMALSLGEFRISILGIIKAGLLLALFLYLANVMSRMAENQISASHNLTPSMQVLFGKFARVALYALAIILALEGVGIDLTVFAVFGGALGLGIGFGLQKVVSNLMSGIILLMDRSVKPGDVIAIGDTFGWINTLGARYVSVVTRDGTEHLIPNEELISQRVENWSYSNKLVRQKIPIGVDYKTDIHKARELAVQAVQDIKRVLKEPKPVCHLIEFGDNSVLLELRIWISDPQNGVANVRSEIQLKIWDLYHEHDVIFPFPQRDLHLKTAVPLTVKMSSATQEITSNR